MKFCFCHPKPDCKPYEIQSYAQYGVQSNQPSNTDLTMQVLFQEGDLISLNNHEIRLASGYLYLIDYVFLATPDINSYFQITPKINGRLNLLYSFFAPSGSAARNASASGSFTTNAAAAKDAVLGFNLTYPETVRNIDITGAISVTALGRIRSS